MDRLGEDDKEESKISTTRGIVLPRILKRILKSGSIQNIGIQPMTQGRILLFRSDDLDAVNLFLDTTLEYLAARGASCLESFTCAYRRHFSRDSLSSHSISTKIPGPVYSAIAPQSRYSAIDHVFEGTTFLHLLKIMLSRAMKG